MRSHISGFLATTALSAPLFFLPVMAGAQSKIGTVAAVNPAMAGTPPNEATRTYSLGLEVVQNERVETRGRGSGQLLFLDQTTLTVAPNSDIVLDKYVYDANQESGEIALTMTKGVLRLIGGRITKKNAGKIKVPTATIGVRGGMALLIVGAGGTSRICNIAGESVEVVPDKGSKITLSRPNACVVADANGARFDGLIKSTQLAEYYDDLEGDGSGGADDIFASVTSVEANAARIARRNSGVKGGENREPVSTSGHSAPPDESARDENQITTDARVNEISSSDPDEEIDENNENDILGDDDIVDNNVVIDDDIIDDGPIVTGLTGASLQAEDGNGIIVSTFDEVLEGSLIGTSANGDLTIPVPGTGENASVFDTGGVLSLIGNPFVSAAVQETGGALFSFDGGFPDTATGILDGGGFSDLLGPISGIGFSDPSEDFTYVEFSADFADDGDIAGVAVFGNATEDSGLFYQGTFAGAEFNDADFDPVTNIATINPILLDPARNITSGVANTVEAYRIVPNFLEGGEFEAPGQPLFIVGNEGMARFDSDVTIDTGNSGINGDDLVGGGKVLFAAFGVDTFVDETGTPLQDSRFEVVADDIKSLQKQGGSSGPILSTTSLGTEQFNIGIDFGDGSIVAAQGVDVIKSSIGNLEDGDGDTQFGEDNRYMVVSSVVRADNGGTLGEPALNPGSGFGLIADFNGRGFGIDLVLEEVESTPFVALTSRVSNLSERINDPLSLARAGAIDNAQTSGAFTRGFMTGVARCETGLCGDAGFQFDNFLQPTGSYQITTTNPDDISFVFDDLSNEVVASVDLQLNNPGDIVGDEVQTLEFVAGGDTSAFIDDERFALLTLDGGATIAGEQTIIDASFATQGLAGTEGLDFPNNAQANHEFLRWGYWSATYEAEQNVGDLGTQTRRDVVHAGNFVTGLRPDAVLDDIPTDVTIAYSGFAIGTTSLLFSPDTAIVTGSFDMTYDFGLDRGDVNINIPNAAPQLPFAAVDINANVQVTGQDLARFSGAAQSDFDGSLTRVNGGFFANPDRTVANNGVAAVGGEFVHTNAEFGFETVGIFGGSATQTTPSFSQPQPRNGNGGFTER